MLIMGARMRTPATWSRTRARGRSIDCRRSATRRSRCRHVETDDLVEARGERSADGAHHPAGGTREVAVLAGKAARNRFSRPPFDCMNIRRTPCSSFATPSTYRRRDRRQVGVPPTVVSPRDTSFINGHLVRHGNLRVAMARARLRDFLLVLPVAVAVASARSRPER